jgi:hypothetical protein
MATTKWKPLGGSGEVAARVGVNSVGVKSVDGEWVVVARCGSVPVCGTAGSAC